MLAFLKFLPLGNYSSYQSYTVIPCKLNIHSQPSKNMHSKYCRCLSNVSCLLSVKHLFLLEGSLNSGWVDLGMNVVFSFVRFVEYRILKSFYWTHEVSPLFFLFIFTFFRGFFLGNYFRNFLIFFKKLTCHLKLSIEFFEKNLDLTFLGQKGPKTGQK